MMNRRIALMIAEWREECDEEAANTLKIIFGIIAGAGGIMTIAGGATLLSRTAKRRQLDSEKETLQRERRSLKDSLASLRLGSPVRNGNQMLTMTFDF